MIAIGLGSNLDQPLSQINHAIAAFDALPGTTVTRQSSRYCSKPMGPQDQPDFINAVILLETDLPPSELLTACHTIEQQQGRQRLRHWGERTIDCDVLLYHNQVITTPTLTVPHPGIEQRAFVLVPLLEIAPNSCRPDGVHYADALAQLPKTDHPMLIEP